MLVKNSLILLILINFFSIDARSEIDDGSTLEFGFGLLLFKAPHYRGADQEKDWIIPYPNFKYVSKNMELEPSYLRGTFYKNDHIAFKLSINAGLSADSEENNARSGMPDLDWTFEAGPMFIWYIWQSEDKSKYLNFEVPIRKVFATSFTTLDSIGVFAVPFLNFVMKAKESNYNIRSEFSLAYMYATKKFHSYFYDVPTEFATAQRPQYSARGGYSGVHATFLFSKKIGRFTVLPFVRYDYLKGAVFDDSPLVRTNSYLLFGTSLSYRLN